MADDTVERARRKVIHHYADSARYADAGWREAADPLFIEALDALIAAVRAAHAPPTVDEELDKLKTVTAALRQSGLLGSK